MLKSWTVSVLALAAFCLPAAPSIGQDQTAPIDDPGSLSSFHERVGQSIAINLTGSLYGSVWGDEVYTSDSTLAAAAVHAGILAPGETATVVVDLFEGLPEYTNSARNGVNSTAYGAWDYSYRFRDPDATVREVLPDPGNLTAYRGQDGAILHFMVTGKAGGSLWGDGVYTDDSELGVAAVHSGLLQDGYRGVITVEILPGQAAYLSSERNGISSSSFGNWRGSFRIVMPPEGRIKSKKVE